MGAGPWQILRLAELGRGYEWTPRRRPAPLYDNVLVALDAGRGLNNGEPAGLLRWLDALALAPGERMLHIGCGVGYYTAIAAAAVPGGSVVGIELDPRLAELRAAEPRAHAERHGDAGRRQRTRHRRPLRRDLRERRRDGAAPRLARRARARRPSAGAADGGAAAGGLRRRAHAARDEARRTPSRRASSRRWGSSTAPARARRRRAPVARGVRARRARSACAACATPRTSPARSAGSTRERFCLSERRLPAGAAGDCAGLVLTQPAMSLPSMMAQRRSTLHEPL